MALQSPHSQIEIKLKIKIKENNNGTFVLCQEFDIVALQYFITLVITRNNFIYYFTLCDCVMCSSRVARNCINISYNWFLLFN